MSPLFVRQTYWDIPCNTSQLPRGIKKLRKVLNALGAGTPLAAGPSFSTADWCEFKVATYRGRQVLLLLEAGTNNEQFCDVEVPLARALVLHQWEHRFQPQRANRTHRYRLFNYIPFRPEYFRIYNALPTARERQVFLQKQLQYHLQQLADRLAWPTDQDLSCDEIQVLREKKVRLGGLHHLAFDLRFSSNLFIPEFIGLGRGVVNGFGVVRPERDSRAKRA